MLALVFSHRHDIRVVEQNVGCLQDGVGKQPDAGVFCTLFLGFVFELGHSTRFTKRRDGV